MLGFRQSRFTVIRSRYFVLVLCLVHLFGCATVEYVSELKNDDLLYQRVGLEPLKGISGQSSERLLQISEELGNDKAGFVSISRTPAYEEFNKRFPVTAHSEASLESITGFNHRRRLGQALIFYADINPSSSGFLKDKDGKPISISGRFVPDATVAVSQGVTSGVVTGATSGMIAVGSINSSLAPAGLKLSPIGTESVMAGQMAIGLAAGVIAGAIHAQMAQDAVNAFMKAQSVAEMMEGSTTVAGHLLPHMVSLGPDGLIKTESPIVVAPGVVKRYFMTVSPPELNYGRRVVIATIVGTYRGTKLVEAYPKSEGWDYRISNLYGFYLQASDFSDAKTSFFAIKRAVRDMNVF